MGIFRKKDSKRDVTTHAQPDQEFRRQSSANDERYRREHAETSESDRFNDAPDASEAERGFPAEGDREPSKRS